MPTALRQQTYPFGSLRKDPHWSVQGLVFYSQFSPAGKLIDESLHGNDGVITGATWAGDGLDFAEASNNDVQIPNMIWNDTGDLTIIIDVMPRTQGEADAGYWFDSNNNATNLLWRDTGGLWFHREFSVTNGSWRTGTDLGFNLNERHTMAIRYKVGELPAVYRDGIFVSDLSQIISPDGTFVSNDNRNWRWGSNLPHNRDWDGIMYGIIVYNRALSASEISTLYLNPNLPMQQPPIWLFTPSVVGVTMAAHYYRHLMQGVA